MIRYDTDTNTDAFHLVSPIIDVASTFIFPIASSSCAMAFTLVYERLQASAGSGVGRLVSGIDNEKKKHLTFLYDHKLLVRISSRQPHGTAPSSE